MRVIKKIKPMFTTVITTMNILEEKDMCFSGTSIIDSSKMRRSVDEFQTVLAVGPHVNGVQVGDLVCINPIRFLKPKQVKKPNQAPSLKDGMEEYQTELNYQFDIIEIDGKPCLKLQDRDIDYVVEDYEEVEEFDSNPTIVTEEHLKGKPRIDLN